MQISLKQAGVVIPLFALFAVALAQSNFEKAVSYYKQGQYEKAAEEFEKIVRESPDYEAGYRVLGDSYLKLRQYPKAAGAFHKAIELDSSKFVSHRGAAIAEYNSGQYQDAVATLLKGEKTAGSPREKYELYHLRGAAYYNLGRYSQAIRDLETAISIQRTSPDDYVQLGISYYKTGESSKAQENLEQALRLNPNSSDAKRFLSQLSYQDALKAIRDGRYSEAITRLTQVVRQTPDDGEAWFNLGLAQLFQNDLDESIQSFEQSAKLLPDNWETYNRLGFLYEKKGQYQRSLSNYQKALQLNSSGPVSESVDRVKERIRRQSETSAN